MIGLYNSLEEIPYNDFNDPYSLCLRYKLGNKCKYFNISNHYKLLDNVNDNSLQYFLMMYKEVYIIPLEFIDGSIYAFQLRSKNEKKFYNIKLDKNLPLVYGWNDIKEYGINIVLCEGIKDYHAIKLIYPYVLAYLTSSPSEKFIEYLKIVSKKIVFISDDDDAGKQLKYKVFLDGISKNYLIKKDPGTYWECNNDLKRNMILDNIKVILKKEKFIF